MNANRNVYYGKVKSSKGVSIVSRNFFVIHGESASNYSKIFKEFEFGQKIKLTIEKMSDKKWKKEVYGDPR